ncbi:S24/S26 family peptidase [Spirosoma radiotolerans]|uniref:hypothetical protein n=1 Tax=Spirosoma radiotolerans TaxID=1379870 RepID=UPI000696E0D8|nr:hypothetical protein [Spirosoma radiotolerans]
MVKVTASTKYLIPFFSSLVQGGFPSPAESYLDKVCNLNDLCITSPRPGSDHSGIYKQWLRLPVGVGIGPTKTLAKVANRLAKNKPELNGVCILDTPEAIDEAL